MLLLEHEGKAVLRDYNVPVPHGTVVTAGMPARPAAGGLAPPFMVKAQILSGGRGKAGGVRLAESETALGAEIAGLLGAQIKGHSVEAVLVEERIAVAHERYLAILLDGEDMLLVIGREGGVEVETFFSGARDGFEVVRIDPAYGLLGYQMRAALDRLGIAAPLWPAYGALGERLFRLFRDNDATLLEINPLGERADGTLIALDARIAIDDGALFRQPRFSALQQARAAVGLPARMAELEVQYVPIGGPVGLVNSGAGLGVTIMDWVEREGGRISAFVDLDYAVIAGRTEEALRLVLETLEADPTVRSILVNFTSCGLRLDGVAASLIEILGQSEWRSKPLFIHLQGNRAAAAHDLIRQAGLPICDRLGDAVRQATQSALEVAA